MTDLIDTTEMYLRTVLELEEEGVPALRARIAERLSHSGPTVSQTVARMERDGLLSIAADRSIELSPEGRQRAVRVMRKHRLAERLLSDVIGLEPEFIHAEACRWEHVMSERVERKILALLEDPTVSPYGNPIPGLEEFGHDGPHDGAAVIALASVSSPVGAGGAGGFSWTGVVVLLGEPLQDDPEWIKRLQAADVWPGRRIEVARDGSELVTTGGLRLPAPVAAHVFVREGRPEDTAPPEPSDADSKK